jgi:hypothetical protein
MRICTLVKAASGLASLCLVAACNVHAADSQSLATEVAANSAVEAQRAFAAPSVPVTTTSAAEASPSGEREPVPNTKQLLDDYFRTLDSGPTRIVLARYGWTPDLVLIDGIYDAHSHAAVYKEFGRANVAQMTVGGVAYVCIPDASTHTYAPGYCDSSIKWVHVPEGLAIDAAAALSKELYAPLEPVPSVFAAIPATRLGEAVIHGTPVTGYAFELSAPDPRPIDEKYRMWLDGNNLVREIQVVSSMVPPDKSPASDGPAASAGGIVTPIPEAGLQADQVNLERSTPGGIPPVPMVPGEASIVTTAQMFDIGTSAEVSPPPRDAVRCCSAPTPVA